ncbi:MAG: holo-ACP synthase [Candidatus Edwardsbacteria bacterium]|nr:holo-ACP synthase [Candidatus Edwardsbacteria bacterium]
MVLGIGADIVAVERFKKLKDKEEFLAQFLSSDELSRAPKMNRDLFYASLFAVKESTLKALGCGLSRGSYWHDIRVTEDIRVSLSGRLLEFLPDVGGHSIHVSVSETGEYAVAYVIIENINK